MVRYAQQDPKKLDYQRVPTQDAGYNIDMFRRGGMFLIQNPANGGTPLEAGIYLIETFEGVVGTVQYVFQIAANVQTGAEFVRHGNGNTWGTFTQRGTGSGGGTAAETTYSTATFPVPGAAATQVQAVLERLIQATFPGGLASRTFNVLNYGADPTGVADSRQAFIDAVAACNTAGGGKIYAPTGLYSIGAGASASLGGVRLFDKMTLEGDGPGKTIIQCRNIGDADMTGLVRTQSGVENDWIVVKDLTLDGNKTAQTGWANTIPFFCGVTPDNRSLADADVWCINVEAKNGRNGTAGSGHDGGGGYGFDPHEIAERINLINCLAHDNEEDGIILDGCTNFLVMGCKSWSNGRHGYNLVTQTQNGQIIGCSGYDNLINNLTIQTDSNTILVSGFISKGAGQQGIRIRRGPTIIDTKITINDCHIEGSGRNGLQLTGAAKNVVSDNILIDNGQTTNNTYFDISLDEDDGDTVDSAVGATQNVIKGNVARASLSNKTKAAYRENSAAVDQAPYNNTYYFNHAVGQVSGKYLTLAATSTVIDAGYGAYYEAIHHGVAPATADNRVALLALVDLVEARGGGTIVLPPGTLNASGTGTASQGIVSLPDGVNLIGAGRGQTILNCLDPIDVDVSGVVRTRSGGTQVGNVVADMTLTSANPSGSGGVDLLFIGGTSDTDFKAINLELLTAREAGSGKYGARVSATSVRATFVDVVAISCERDGFYDLGTDTTFLNCSAISNLRHGFYTASSTRPQFIGCRSYNNASNQLIIENALHAKVLGGDYDANSINVDCVRIKGGATTDMYATIQGATIRNSGRDGLSIAGSNRNRIIGNTFLDNGRQTNNTYHDVSIELDTAVTSSFNIISNNTMVSTAANKTSRGVNEASTCNNNNVTFNTYSGQVSGPVALTGAASVRLDSGYFQFKDDAFTLMDEADLTKLVKFQLSALSTGVTRTITVPDKSGTMAMLDDVTGFSGVLAQEIIANTPSVPSASNAALVGVPKGTLTLAGTNFPGTGNRLPFARVATALAQAYIVPRANATTLDSFGIGTATTGTGVNYTPSFSGTRMATMKRVGYSTTASINSSAGVRMNAGWLARGSGNSPSGGFLVSMVFGFVTTPTTGQFFAGVYASNLVATGAAEPSTLFNLFGVGKDAGDTNLQFMRNDGSGTAAKTDLGADYSMTADRFYEVWIYVGPNGTDMEMFIRRLDAYASSAHLASSDIPAATSTMGVNLSIGNGTTAQVATFDFMGLYAEMPWPVVQP